MLAYSWQLDSYAVTVRWCPVAQSIPLFESLAEVSYSTNSSREWHGLPFQLFLAVQFDGRWARALQLGDSAIRQGLCPLA